MLSTMRCAITFALILYCFCPKSAIANSSNVKLKPRCHIGNLNQQPAKVQGEMTSFLGKLQAAIREDNRSQVAGMISYPLNVWINGKNSEVESKQEFIHLYDQIFTTSLRDLLLEQQPTCISRIGIRGFSISRGEIWFDFYPDGRIKIFTVTPIVMPDEY